MKVSRVIMLSVIILVHFHQLMADVKLQEHVLRADIGGACSIVSGDFDQDGDFDLALTISGTGRIIWMENDGHQSFTDHEVISGFNQARALDICDMDGDGDLDLVATAYGLNRFSWFENNGSGEFTEHIVADGWTGASWVIARDMDQDGDMDVIGTACDGNQIGWFENDGSQNFTEHVLKNNWTKANSAWVADMDNDGDLDIIGTAKEGSIIWFVNNGHQVFEEREIYTNWQSANSVRVDDLDKDGDMDLVATCCAPGNQVAWFENNGNGRFIKHLLKDQYTGSRQCEITDLDQDGDLDILSIAWVSGVVTFWENRGNQEFREYEFCDDAFDMLKLFVIDLDQDNDLDIAGACFGDDEVRWWENIDLFLTADFEVNERSGHAPVEVEFSDFSSGRPNITDWEWDFDCDGVVDSREENPVWEFTSPGIYNVSLTVQNEGHSEVMTWSDCIRVFDGNSAVEFDGSKSYIEAVPVDLVSLSDAFSFSCWIKPSGFGEGGAGHLLHRDQIKIFIYESGASIDNEQCLAVTLKHEDGTLSKLSTPSMSIVLDEWQHILVSYEAESSELKVFINEQEMRLLVQTETSGLIDDRASNSFFIGNHSRNNRTFDGVIDEVRVYKSAMATDDELVGYWNFDEGSGDQTTDQSTHFRVSTLKNARWIQGWSATTGISFQDIIALTKIHAYPNPFSETITIEIPDGDLLLGTPAIYDLSGKMIYSFNPDEFLRRGTIVLHWDGHSEGGRDVPFGVYLLRLEMEKTGVSSIKLIKQS